MNNSLQIQFLNKIKDIIPATHSLVDELADLLEISNDSVYRRMRGETALTLEELSKISSHYKISFDMFSDQATETVTFSYNSLTAGGGFKQYLLSILNDMIKINRAENKQIIYAAIDVPIFHHFNYPELAAFKMFYWMKAVINEPLFEGKKFDTSIIDKELTEIGKQIYLNYSTIPSIEIWTAETINSLLKQIEFYWESGLFQSKTDALTVCSQVESEIKLIQKQAETGNKAISEKNGEEQENTFTLYHSEIEIGNNCILVTKGDIRNVYLSFHTFNKIVTGNPRFSGETQLWLNNLMRKSILISGVSEKQRYQFFKRMMDKISALYKKIENQ